MKSANKKAKLNRWVEAYVQYLNYIEQFKFDPKDILDDLMPDEEYYEKTENMNDYYSDHPTMWDWVKIPEFIWLRKNLVRASKEMATVVDDRQFRWLLDDEGNKIRKVFIE